MFSVTVFYDERIVIVAEQRPDASEEDSFQWMSRVLQVNHILVHEFYLKELCIFQKQDEGKKTLFIGLKTPSNHFSSGNFMILCVNLAVILYYIINFCSGH